MTLAKLLRILAFIGGGLGVIVESIQHAGEITGWQALLVAATAAIAYSAKWPTDATADEAQERVDRAVRRSIMPPPGDGPREMIDVPGGSHTLVPRTATLSQAELASLSNRLVAFPTCKCQVRQPQTLQGLCPVCGLQPRIEQ